MQLPDAALGSIVAAFIAGLVVFISTVLAKEQKTSEFRQVWIDELRKDISQFMSGTSEVVAWSTFKKGDKTAHAKFLEDNFKLIQELQSVEHRIILRLNPNKHADLIDNVLNYRKNMLAAYSGANRRDDEKRISENLLTSTKSVLKCEWERVKKGEPAFRFVKWVALMLIVILSGIIIKLWFFSNPAAAQIGLDGKKNSLDGGAKVTNLLINSRDCLPLLEKNEK